MDDEQRDEAPAPGWRDEHSPALVARVARDIDNRSQDQHTALLSDLLCAAWPGVRAQMQ
ncbi:MAG TPA: hypothetical protein VGX51_05090 [Solirubrobacteraceae bacterium]|nr:hypothetical protein [Solirubrobacteraceae bacterium]